ncbi:MAG: exodeoxyribonuclease V subunit alpha [Desulfuromonas sp.]|nr:MAG: exodeoxyribonuclease V subunit alpha [Desulfuromonas sp.]
MPEISLADIDRHFARYIYRQERSCHAALISHLAALVSHSVSEGHTCLDLTTLVDSSVLIDDEQVDLPPLDVLKRCFVESSTVGKAGEYKPLIVDEGERLYLHRYWTYESDLATALLTLAESTDPIGNDSGLFRFLDDFFPPLPGPTTDWQRMAALTALRKRFCVISGGPGTGKTTTVVKILALLQLRANNKLKIALAAPTGKSAARLKESIATMTAALPCTQETRQVIPQEVKTLHRLLGYRAGSVQFRHNSDNRLPYDVVVIDEASMVPLTLMAKLVAALKSTCRLILLGDRDQLASVEAGAVLGDLCGPSAGEPFSADFATLMMRAGARQSLQTIAQGQEPPLTDTLLVLKQNYRFADNSGIARLSRLVNRGDGEGALAVTTDRSFPDIALQDLPAVVQLQSELHSLLAEHYAPYLRTDTAAQALCLFDRFRILCALRSGPFGVDAVNSLAQNCLARIGLIDPQAEFYHGRPVMITVNDYHLDLYNGDIGIVLKDGERFRVYFAGADGQIRDLPVTRLPRHETVYAMTIHKSQGSEFEHVLTLLPERDGEGLGRELLYTAITRARSSAHIWAKQDVFQQTVSSKIGRRSGLRARLWPGQNSDQ